MRGQKAKLSHFTYVIAIFTLLVAALCLGACSQQETKQQTASPAATQTSEQNSTVSFTDSAGRTVEVPAHIDKIVPSGHTANMVLLTIAPEKMVGLSQQLNDKQKKYVGSALQGDLPVLGAAFGSKGDLNKEAVAASGAQILIDTGEFKKGIADKLDELQKQLGIPCVFIESKLDQWPEAYRMLGKLLDKEARAEELATYCERAYADVKAVMDGIPDSERPRVLYCTGESATNVLAKGSFQSGVVDMLARNVAEVDAPSAKGSGNESSLEQIAAWDPQIILFNGAGKVSSAYDVALADPAWQSLKAMKEGSYLKVPAVPYNWLNSPPTVNQVLGMQWLSHELYPDKFKDSTTDLVKSYFKNFYGYELSEDEYQKIVEHAQLNR